MNRFSFEPLYPDVLGAITNGSRIDMESLQCALGIFPRQTYINQPVELVLILQNMVDQNMQLKIGLQLPTEDRKGRPVVIDTPRKTLSLGLRPGEVGVLRTPIVPRPPTPPAKKLPLRIAVRYRTPQPGRRVRPIAGGPPPGLLSISSFKLQVLRDVHFAAETWHDSSDILTTYFDVAPKIMPALNLTLKTQYEALWTHEQMVDDELPPDRINAAYRVASRMTRTAVYAHLLDEVEKRFGNRDLPLHPGEAMAIAKMMTYTLDEGLDLEPGFSVEESQWFKTLCHVLAYDESLEDMDKGELAVEYLFESALFDAVLLAFGVIGPRVREDLGDDDEQVNYANRIMTWLTSQGQPDLSYAYLPLIMGAIVINELATVNPDNPWTMLDLLREAQRGRARLFTGEKMAVFNMTADLLKFGEEALRRSRVPRP
jgi:hypothetical protein